MNEPQHRDTFAPPVFKSRVVEARLRIQASGLRFVWDEARGEYVLTDEDPCRKLFRFRHSFRTLKKAGDDNHGNQEQESKLAVTPQSPECYSVFGIPFVD